MELRAEYDCKPSTEVRAGHQTTFIGLDLKRNPSSYLCFMPNYINILPALEDNAQFEAYRIVRAKLLWVLNARPDICAFVSL